MNKEELWKNTLASLEVELSKANFAAFLKKTKLASLSNEQAVILCPNSLVAEWLRKRYQHTIKEILTNLIGREISLQFAVRKKEQKLESPEEPSSQKNNFGPLFRQKVANDNLSPSYSFDSFVVGISNQLAHTAALAVAKQPGVLHNPLFLHAGVGLGKTHLMHAVGNKIKSGNPEARIRYCPAERFTNELIEAIQNGRTVSQFRRRFRDVDILLIDDVQFLAGREATQEEFFNTFNELYLSEKQIVLASDRHPQEIKSLEARLVSRFSGGMVADIQAPDLELRIAILKKRLAQEGSSIKEEALVSLAEQFAGSIRQLEGALNQMLFLLQNHQQADPEKLLPLVVGDRAAVQAREAPTPSKVIEETCKKFAVAEKDLISAKRTKELVISRQAAMYLLRKTSTLSLTKIGEVLGGKDHSTILYGIRTAKKRAQDDPLFQQQLQAIKNSL